jgi:putative transcriptional regulator
MASSLRGQLMVALPPLVDENFDRTVVLVLEHNDDGALGLVLNRPSEHDVAELLAPWAALAAPPAVLFGGGPVETEAVIGLARAGARTEGSAQWAPLSAGIGTVDLSADPGDVEPPLDAVRLFAGYAGWGPGQLENELAAAAWIAAAFRPEDAFSADPDELWRTVLRRQGGTVAWLANYPDDPSLN